MANNDFFLKFGSDAQEFSTQLGTDLAPGIGQIEALTAALAAYDAQVQRLGGGKSPASNIGAGLDKATERLSNVSAQITNQFDKIASSVEALVKPLQQALSAAEAAGKAATTRKSSTNAARVGDDEIDFNVNRSKSEPGRARTTRPRAEPAPAKETNELANLYVELKDATRNAIEKARTALSQIHPDDHAARVSAVGEVAPQFLADPRAAGPRSGQVRDLRDLLSLPESGRSNALVREGFTAADRTAQRERNRAAQGSIDPNGIAGAAQANTAFAAILKEVSGLEGDVRAKTLALLAAQSDLNTMVAKGTATNGAYARQLKLVESAADAQALAILKAKQAEAEGNAPGANIPTAEPRFQNLFGQQGLSANLQRHVGRALENTVAYTLIFQGVDKLKEVMHTGLETDAAFVRLNASLAASGKSAGSLRSEISSISANTATPIQHIVEAASELVGVFNNTADLAFGTKIASQLANISQGTLTAKEAAIGLRNVIDAYGLTGPKAVQSVADQIAHLSQITGVSIKDITEGTTQIAQTSKEFGLSQPQASVLAAYISRNTGLSGEQSAGQASRLLGSLQKGPIQDSLVKAKIATREDFNTGNFSNVLSGLMERFRNLPEPLKATISAQLGQGQQERAFAAVTNVGQSGQDEFKNPSTSAGALNRQNAAFLKTIAGSVKQLDENFQNLGSTLARLGALDFLGALAKTLNFILATVNTLGNKLADIFGGSVISTGILHITTTLLEAAAAIKLFGGLMATGLGRAGLRGAVNADLIGAAKANNAALVSQGLAAGAIPAAEYGAIGFPGSRRRAAAKAAATAAAEAEAVAAAGGLAEAGTVAGAAGAAGGGLAEAELALGAAGAAGGLAGLKGQASRLAARAKGGVASLGASAAERQATRAAGQSLSSAGFLAEDAVGAAGGLAGVGSGLKSVGASAGSALASIGPLALQLGALGALAAVAYFAIKNQTNKNSRRDSAFAIATGSDLTDPAMQNIADKANSTKNLSIIDRVEGWANFVGNVSGGLQKGPSGGKASKSSQQAVDKLIKDKQNQLKDALATADPALIQTTENQIQTSITDQAKGISKTGHNDADAQTTILAKIAKLRADLDKQGTVRLAALAGLSNLDVLTQQQIEGISTYVGRISGLNAETLKKFTGSTQQFFNDTGVSASSGVGKNLLGAASGTASYVDRQKATRDALTTTIQNEQIRLNDPNQLPYGDPRREAAQQKLVADQQAYQAAQTATLTAPQATAEGTAALAAKQGHFAIAGDQAKEAAKNAQAFADSIQNDDPAAFYAALQHVQDLKSQAADYEIQAAQNALALRSASTADPVIKAHLAITAAQNALGAALKGGDATKIAAAQNTLGGANISGAQADEAKTAAENYAKNASIRNVQAKAQADLTETLRQQAVYAKSGIHDATKLAQLKATEAANRIAIADATQAQTQAQYDITAAYANLRGDAVGAAQAALNKAQQAYGNAVSVFGAGSQQAAQAQASAIAAQQAISATALAEINSALDLQIASLTIRGDSVGVAQATLAKANNALASYQARGGQTGTAEYNRLLADAETALKGVADARLAQINSALDLQIAQLNARGKLGDTTRAAQDAVKKAQNAIAAYKAAGGKSGTATYNQLAGDLATAQRTAFDTALQAQLDTIEFQRSTYQITASQEIKALQTILLNKQLTLAEQRSITLQIRTIQQSIREQLTQGGLNIPSDIKLPTAYEVRRSLGAGFGGARTAVSQVNNNQRTQVTITQNVPTAAVATQIANQVIKTINQQTGQQVRANSTTPRLVSTS